MSPTLLGSTLTAAVTATFCHAGYTTLKSHGLTLSLKISWPAARLPYEIFHSRLKASLEHLVSVEFPSLITGIRLALYVGTVSPNPEAVWQIGRSGGTRHNFHENLKGGAPLAAGLCQVHILLCNSTHGS